MWLSSLVDDKTAEEFSIYMKKFSDLYISLSKIVKNYTMTSQPRILDLGAGPGLLSLEILKQIPDAMVIGIDPLLKMMILAKENINQSNLSNFEPVLGVSNKLPLKDKSIDIIVSRFSLSYWKQPTKSFLEMYRVLNPGGKIVLEVLNNEYPKWKLLYIKMKMIFNHARREVIKYHVDAYSLAYTQEEIEMFFKNSGFHILEKDGKKNEWKFIIVAEKK